MAEHKPFASLSSGLLARKGGAKPAMRPQGYGHFGGSIEDLGWNDMGEHEPEPVAPPTPASGLTPAPVSRPPVEPIVREQQRSLAARIQAGPAEVVALPRARTAPAKAKAAFTLRLDPERHLKLRLACALAGRSAQQLVTEALDEFLESLPEVEALAHGAAAEAGGRKR
jgi:hypothetical protein